MEKIWPTFLLRPKTSVSQHILFKIDRAKIKKGKKTRFLSLTKKKKEKTQQNVKRK
jgi:hypothetical protein